METVNGADGPTINKAIIDQLLAEHNVLETGGTRVEVERVGLEFGRMVKECLK